MTYQAARPNASAYGRNIYANGRTHINREISRNSYRPARSAQAPERKKAKGLSREEMLWVREAEMRRRRREEAESARLRDARIRQAERDISRTKAYESEMKRKEQQSVRSEKAKLREKARLESEAALRREIKVPRQKMPWQFIICVAIVFTLLMAMVYSFAQVSESNRELSEIKSQISEAEEKADKLKLQLEEKNDLTMIEKIATEEYNMVKEGSVQKKYISLSEGDRVVLDNNAETEEENVGFMNGMMSSAASMFDDLLDYIK
ncbi:MAG: septum formation initiator family protein [Clostridia bacterium]|nr:septum formation initiator family protein [Clostridia bacterium]